MAIFQLFFLSDRAKDLSALLYVVIQRYYLTNVMRRDEFRDGDLKELYEDRSPIAILWHCTKNCFQLLYLDSPAGHIGGVVG